MAGSRKTQTSGSCSESEKREKRRFWLLPVASSFLRLELGHIPPCSRPYTNSQIHFDSDFPVVVVVVVAAVGSLFTLFIWLEYISAL